MATRRRLEHPLRATAPRRSTPTTPTPTAGLLAQLHARASSGRTSAYKLDGTLFSARSESRYDSARKPGFPHAQRRHHERQLQRLAQQLDAPGLADPAVGRPGLGPAGKLQVRHLRRRTGQLDPALGAHHQRQPRRSRLWRRRAEFRVLPRHRRGAGHMEDGTEIDPGRVCVRQHFRRQHLDLQRADENNRVPQAVQSENVWHSSSRAWMSAPSAAATSTSTA